MKRDGRIELLRFMAAVFIMVGHMGAIGYDVSRPFSDAWFYVEFFLMLTGFFTAKHFLTENPISSKEKWKVAITYTASKFKRFFIYTTPAILITYVVDSISYIESRSITGFLHNFEDMPFEMLYLSAANRGGY